MKKKTYVSDTNVFLHDPNAIYAFDDNELVIPMVVLEELDKQKSRQDEVGANARSVCRQLDDLRKQGSLMKGVVLPSGGTVRTAVLDVKALKKIPCELNLEKNDNLILAVMLTLNARSRTRSVVLVSRDINVRIKGDALGLKCEDYRKTKLASNVDDLYSGVAVINVTDDELASFYQSDRRMAAPQGTFPNQICVLKPPLGGSTLTKCVLDDTGNAVLVPLADIPDAFGLKPRNKEQQFALDLLYDQSIKLVTLSGAAGCGKSLISIASALDQLKGVGNRPVYDKFIVMRPVQPVGRDIGFLPGTLEEKMEPWVGPIRDNINFLLGSKGEKRPKNRRSKDARVSDDVFITMAQENGLIEVEAITFMRGRSIPNAFILIDESQNLSIHELKTLITRAGEGTKIVLTGDIKQIDNTHVDTFTNGLTYAIEKFKEHDIAGHVTLKKGERGKLATLASEIL